MVNRSFIPDIPLRMWVVYDRSTQKRLIDGIMTFHLGWMRDSVLERDEDPQEVFTRAGLSLAMFFDAIVQTFKGKKWERECEFRFVFQHFEGFAPSIQVFTRTFRGIEKQYIKADFSSAELRRVVIGPSNDVREAAAWLRGLLDENDRSATAIETSVISAKGLQT